MALDSATKRRSMLAMGVLALVVHPVPDATIAAIDQKHFLGLMAAVATTVGTTHIHKYSTGPIQPNHAADSGDNVLYAGVIEAQEGGYFGGPDNYVEQAPGGVILHGDARVVNHLILHAGSFKLHGGDAAGVEAAGIFPVLDFADGSLSEAFGTQFIPFRWDSDTDIRVEIDWLCDNDATGGDVVWNVSYLSIKSGEEVGAAPVVTLNQAFTGAGAGLLLRSSFTTKIIKANLAVDDIMGIRIFREANGAGDTLTETARFVALHLHYIRNKHGEAL